MSDQRFPLIAVDIGNSSVKLAVFTEGAAGPRVLPIPRSIDSFSTHGDMPREIAAALPPEARWRVASVHREGERRLAQWVNKHRPDDDYLQLTFRDLPLEVRVDYPNRVGLDRLAAAAAVNVLRDPSSPAVVIDAGSAVTIDLVSADGAFEGGVILPGFRMSAQALASAADLLPLALLDTTAAPPPVLGKSTEAAIRSGLFWGAVGAAREIVARYAEMYPHPQIFITGGDLQRLAGFVSDDAVIIPDLVPAGIALSSR